MNKGQNGSSLVGKNLKIPRFLEALAPGLCWFSYSILLDSGGRGFGGWRSPADRWWLIESLLAAGPLCPGSSFSSTATASEAGAVSQPAPLSAGGVLRYSLFSRLFCS